MTSHTNDDPLGIKDSQQKQDESVVEDREKLKISHTPDELKFRQEEINTVVSQLFEDALYGREGEDIVITGRPGTGKTAAVKHVIEKVNAAYDTSQIDIAYINCKMNNSKQEVFKAIMNSLGLEYKRGIGVGENIRKLLKEYRESGDPTLVVVLDELDELYKGRRNYINDILYTLSRPDENFDSIQFSGDINQICVSNDNQLYNYLQFDVDDSSFSPERLEFLPYKTEEINQILMSRQEEAYSEPILDEPAMKRVAEVVSERFNGDIRVGIRILKKIPKYVNEGLPESIPEQHEILNQTIDDVKRSRIEKVLNGKDEHFLLTMSAMLQNFSQDKSKLSVIVDSYRRACEKASLEKGKGDFSSSGEDSKSKSRSYVRRKLEYLVDEGILTKEKDYDEPRNPYKYQPEVDVGLFNEMVAERLKRNGVYSKLEDIEGWEHREIREKAEEEFDEVMNEIGYVDTDKDL